MKFGLVGNPNCGKTTLFNRLTGSTAHVGNWPGVTVDKKEGVYKKLFEKVDIIDLPGIYSLSPYTKEEVVSRNFIVDSDVDCIINIVDATNIERNLYLTTQLLEIDVPIIIALNMMDVVRSNGTKIIISDLENKLNVKVCEISALKGDGIDELMKEAYKCAKTKRSGNTVINNKELLELINETKKSFENIISSPLFHAVKLIENDEIELEAHKEIEKEISVLRNKVNTLEFDGDFEAMIADERYKFIEKSFSKSIIKSKISEKMTKSDRIDKVLTHKIFSIPIFLICMFIIFHLVFSEDLLFLNAIFGLEVSQEGWVNFLTGMGYDGLARGAAISGEVFSGIAIPSPGVFLQSWMGYLTGLIISLFEGFMKEGTWYTSLIVDGLLTGIDAIFSFIPQVLLLFLFISILEDSGYMARVAFIMDRAFRKFGLSGKAFIPLLMGFGCSVPAMMGSKTLESEKERDLTIRLIPFFSCGAKAPIWAMLATVLTGTFLGDIFVFGIYLLGIVVAIVASIFTKLLSKNTDTPPFIMELPAYHLPQGRNLLAHLWEKFKHFVYKASTIITASIIVIWFLSNFSFAFWKGMVNIDDSMLATIGRGLKYFFYPLGFSQGAEGYKYSVAVVTGLIAKEDVVGTMATLGLTEATITLTSAQILSFATYNLFTFPCFAAISTAKSESSKKGFAFTMLFWFTCSYVVALAVYLLASLCEVSVLWFIIVLLVIILLIVFSAIKVLNRQKQLIKNM